MITHFKNIWFEKYMLAFYIFNALRSKFHILNRYNLGKAYDAQIPLFKNVCVRKGA